MKTEYADLLKYHLDMQAEFNKAVCILTNINLSNWNEQADFAYHFALALKIEYANSCCDMGCVSSRLQRYTEAEAYCREAIKYDPEMPEAYNNLAVVLSNTGGVK